MDYKDIQTIVSVMEKGLPMAENKEDANRIITYFKGLIFFDFRKPRTGKPMEDLTDGELSLLLHALTFNKDSIINNPKDNMNDTDSIECFNDIISKLSTAYNIRIGK